MARAKVVHSEDAVTILFKGNPQSPEPGTGIIKFPGGNIEVSRTSNGEYWAHISIDENSTIEDSRLAFNANAPFHLRSKIHDIEGEDFITQLAVRIKGTYKEPGE